MEITREEFKQNIMEIVDSFNNQAKSKAYRMFLYDDDRITPIPEVVKMVIYDMFINEYDSVICAGKLRYAYNSIHDYTLELQKVGYVTFLN